MNKNENTGIDNRLVELAIEVWDFVDMHESQLFQAKGFIEVETVDQHNYNRTSMLWLTNKVLRRYCEAIVLICVNNKNPFHLHDSGFPSSEYHTYPYSSEWIESVYIEE